MPTTSYKKTVYACYLGNFTQAVLANIVPLLFVALRTRYGLSYSQLGLLVFANFLTQVAADLIFSGVADKHGFRPIVVAAPLMAFAGLLLFALTPNIFNNVYTGFLISTVIFSGSGGMLEVTLSPIVNAIPTDEKAGAMSVLHSFYSWGQAVVVVATTLLIAAFGADRWQYILGAWTVLPLATFAMFTFVPLAPHLPEGGRMQRFRELVGERFLTLALLTIAFGAAAEVSISQWSSAFMEKGLGLSKLTGDMLGVAFFAVMMALGRLYFGLRGAKMRLRRAMIIQALIAAVCYVAVALSPLNVLSVAACGIAGVGVSLLWPGTLVLSSQKYPLAGAWMFALLATAGDIGAAAGPWVMGVLTDAAEASAAISRISASLGLTAEQLALRASMLAGTVFPALTAVFLIMMGKGSKDK